MTTAAEMLRQFEGNQPQPYWDQNAWRIGYGSDTITRPDGSFYYIGNDPNKKPNVTITDADAERDLARRVPEFVNKGIVPYVGASAWANLSPQAQAAVTSLAYNYGSLAELPSLVAAIKTGDPNKIADAVKARAVDNNGINEARRLKEAAAILGHPIPPGMVPDVATALSTTPPVTPGPARSQAIPLPAPTPLIPTAKPYEKSFADFLTEVRKPPVAAPQVASLQPPSTSTPAGPGFTGSFADFLNTVKPPGAKPVINGSLSGQTALPPGVRPNVQVPVTGKSTSSSGAYNDSFESFTQALAAMRTPPSAPQITAPGTFTPVTYETIANPAYEAWASKYTPAGNPYDLSFDQFTAELNAMRTPPAPPKTITVKRGGQPVAPAAPPPPPPPSEHEIAIAKLKAQGKTVTGNTGGFVSSGKDGFSAGALIPTKTMQGTTPNYLKK